MKLIIFALISSFLILSPVKAEASRIDILPRKIVLDDRQRSTEITLLNLSQKPAVVRISLISYEQKPTGEYRELDGPLNVAFDPEQLVRISPKQFSLPAGGRQKVRLSVQRPAELPDGEYRFHIKALSFDEDEFSVRRSPTERGSTAVIKTNIGVAVPVVVRKGDLTETAKLENITYLPPEQSENKRPSLKIDVKRSGTAGTIGTLRAYSSSGGPREIGVLNNVNVFSEIESRTVVLPLKEVPQGTIRLRYEKDHGDKGVIDEVVVEK